jgi:hypothetical protein
VSARPLRLALVGVSFLQGKYTLNRRSIVNKH